MLEYINTILNGDAVKVLTEIPPDVIDCCVTSPPYFNLRDYGTEGQIGLEDTPDEYVENLVRVFSEVKRVLKDSGSLWLNVGDSYSTKKYHGCKPKDMIGIPWMLAFALRESGWYIRNDIIWNKPNSMPQPVKDRFVSSYEHVFLMTKSKHYYFDTNAVREKSMAATPERRSSGFVRARKLGYNTKRSNNPKAFRIDRKGNSLITETDCEYSGGSEMRNRRDVWAINTKPSAEKHVAQFPQDLVRLCLLAGCPENGIVLDPFIGSGTTGLTAVELNRNYVGIDINAEYVDIAKRRIREKHDRRTEKGNG